MVSHYKEIVTSRGLKYNYYFAAPTDSSKPFLVFIHGFPSLSTEWRHQTSYFGSKGYGIIAPDMLGYGGTDKPADAKFYAHSLLAKDVIDILDAEKVVKPFVIGHDWGSKTTSVLANRYQDHFAGFAFLAVGYTPPNTTVTYETVSERFKKGLGYDAVGYWDFFSTEGTDKILGEHTGSAIDLLYAKDYTLWKTNFCPKGGYQAWLESDSRTPRADYITDAEGKHIEETFSKNGWTGPVSYYKVATSTIDIEDNKDIPTENYVVQKPVFFGGAARDPICIPAWNTPKPELCPDATTKVFDAGHWVMLERASEVNAALEEWFIAKS